MNIKIEFVLSETGEYESFEVTLKENVKVHDFVFFTSELNNEKYAYVIGDFRIWKPKRNVICVEEVKLLKLKIEYNFE